MPPSAMNETTAAIRSIASDYAYDHAEDNEVTLRGGGDEVSLALQKELAVRLAKAGVAVEEARLTHLACDARNDELLGDIADVLWKLGKRQVAQVLWREARDLDGEDSEWAMKLARVRAGKDPLE